MRVALTAQFSAAERAIALTSELVSKFTGDEL